MRFCSRLSFLSLFSVFYSGSKTPYTTWKAEKWQSWDLYEARWISLSCFFMFYETPERGLGVCVYMCQYIILYLCRKKEKKKKKSLLISDPTVQCKIVWLALGFVSDDCSRQGFLSASDQHFVWTQHLGAHIPFQWGCWVGVSRVSTAHCVFSFCCFFYRNTQTQQRLRDKETEID